MDREIAADELIRISKAHLQSLRQAGIDWLPAPSPTARQRRIEPAPPPKAAVAPPAPLAAAPVISVPPTLFAEPELTAAPQNQASLEERRVALQTLKQEVTKCMKCAGLASTRTQIVFADGEPGVELCFVGEAPGADEDAQGLPFVGEAGKLLNRIIAACGMKREDVYICNIIKCRPPGNRTPLPDEAAHCRSFLERQLALVQPRYIVALGSCAAQNLLGTTVSIGKLRGRFHDYKGIPVMCTYHPAYLLPHRSPEKKKEVWDDMQWLMNKMGRTIPART